MTATNQVEYAEYNAYQRAIGSLLRQLSKQAPYVLLMTVGVALAGGCSGENASSSLPDMHFKTQLRDLGVVVPGARLEARFPFVNNGRGILRVTDIKTSCGCAAGKTTLDVLAPGEKSELVITFDVPDASSINHSAIVKTNDATSPHLLSVVATPRWPLDVKPRSLNLPLSISGRSEQRQLEVYATEGESCKILSVETSARFIKCRATSENGRRSILQVVVTPEKLGTFAEHIYLTTSNSKRSKIDVAVSGNVASVARVQPSRLLLGSRPPHSVVPVLLKLRSFDMSNQQLSLTCTDKDWRVSEYSVNIVDREAKEWHVNVDLLTPPSEGFHQTELEIKSTLENLRIPVSSYVHDVDAVDKATE